MQSARAALPVVLALLLCSAASATSPPEAAAKFDSSRAFEHIRQLVAIGPRPPGSPGIEQARTYIVDQLKTLGLMPTLQSFVAQTPLGPMKMANVIVRIAGAAPERILLTGHYDTKLFRQFRFVGANDGGSSAAMLLEMARVLKDRKSPFTIELVFFDGEEATLPDWGGTDHTYGSRHYVQEAKGDGSLSKVRALILFDMVADRQLNIRRETYSTRWLTDLIWASARKLGHDDAFVADGFAVEDDHKAFLDAGVPSVDIIDLDYAPWHTARDDLDAISARSLQMVGDVVLDALPKIEAKLK